MDFLPFGGPPSPPYGGDGTPLFWGSSEQRGFVHHWGGLRHRRMAVTGASLFFGWGGGKGEGCWPSWVGPWPRQLHRMSGRVSGWVGGWVGGRVGGLMSEGGGVGR